MKGRLYTSPNPPGIPSLAYRILFVLVLVVIAITVIYFEGGLVDNTTGEHPNFIGCVYYAVITITTVGYGDIVPVTTQARVIDILLLTPIRFLVLTTFFGTAYQLIYQRLQEGFRMSRAVDKLSNHFIVCGYGGTGREAVRELLLHGHDPEQIVVVDTSEAALERTQDLGVTAVVGDATQEGVLQSVAVERASHILIAPGRDDTAILTALTASDLNPKADITVACRRSENIKLLRRSGAHTIVASSAAGGRLMAAATRQPHLVDTMRDMLTIGGAIQMHERKVSPSEVGKDPESLPDIAVLRVYRGDETFSIGKFQPLQAQDSIVYASTNGNGAPEDIEPLAD
jgi:voltage-gated potassium channel